MPVYLAVIRKDEDGCFRVTFPDLPGLGVARLLGELARTIGLPAVVGELSAGLLLGKTVLGRITKRGDEYLRLLLVQGARSAVASAAKRTDPISRWIVQLQARVGWQKTLVAVANKNARILWAVLARGRTFDARYAPQPAQATPA